MADPTPETGNSWRKRLMRFFRRDKTKSLKIKTETTSETRDKRAFTISLVMGIMFGLITIIQVILHKDDPLNSLSDPRVSVALVSIPALIGAWFARRGNASLGISLALGGLISGASLAAIITSGAGISIAAILMLITLGVTSATMPVFLARRINLIVLCLAAIPILLDLFEPFARPPDSNPASTLTTTAINMVVFAVLIVRRFNTYDLRTKLLIAFAAVTVLPLIGIGYYDSFKLSDALYQNTQEALGHFADQTALHVDTFTENQLVSIQAQAQNPLLIELLSLTPAERVGSQEENSARTALKALTAQDKAINAYTLLDNKGIVVLDTANREGQDDSQAQFFKQTLSANQAIVSGPFFDQKNSKGSLYFSAPVKNQVGKTLGFLAVEYDANVIENIVERLIPPNNPQNIFFHIVDKNNFIRIANTNNTELLYKSYKDFTPAQIATLQKQSLLLPGTAQDALAVEDEIADGLEKLDQSPFFTTTDDKVLKTKYLNSGTELKNTPWLVFVQQSDAAVTVPLAQQKRTTAIIFIVLLTLITLAAFGLAQLLASPILKLAAIAQKIAAGDLSLQSDIESNDEIGTLAGAFNEMTRQTRALIDSLEQRSKALATSSEVSRRISTILDQQQLVTEVVKQVQSAFNYYHAHIYLLDERTQELIMAGGTGEAGKAMLARGHKIPMGKGLVGRAAQNNVTVLVTDVSEDPQWLPNPLLPDTKSEVAVPISIADKILGVLDVQHNVAGVLKQEDVDVLQSIANQVAFAVRNARSYSEVEAKADRESLITSIGQKIQGTITVEGALQVAIREIGRALNGARTQVVLNEASATAHLEDDKNIPTN